jgi:hypothetical protein
VPRQSQPWRDKRQDKLNLGRIKRQDQATLAEIKRRDKVNPDKINGKINSTLAG